MNDCLSFSLIHEESKNETEDDQPKVFVNDGFCRRIKGLFNINTWFEVNQSVILGSYYIFGRRNKPKKLCE